MAVSIVGTSCGTMYGYEIWGFHGGKDTSRPCRALQNVDILLQRYTKSRP